MSLDFEAIPYSESGMLLLLFSLFPRFLCLPKELHRRKSIILLNTFARKMGHY